MPLRDHFHPPLINRHRWNELHVGWPMMIVKQLYDLLPKGFVAAPRVQLGQFFEIDVAALECDDPSGASPETGSGNGGVALAAPPKPTLTLETNLPEQDEFEVRIYDTQQQVVAAIEIVSPANKDRPENRRAFAAKVTALLQKEVCVSIVDLVTIRHFNLYADLLEFIEGEVDPELGPNPPSLYSVTFRSRKNPGVKQLPGTKPFLLDLWYYPMMLGQTLPTLPLWLTAEQYVLLPLEASYEETCRLLHIS